MLQAKQIFGSLGNATVYQQGGTPNADLRVYTTFRDALDAAQQLQPLGPTIIIDPSFGAPIVPPGSFPIVGNLTLSAPLGAFGFGFIPPTLTIQDGAFFGAFANTGFRVTNALRVLSMETSHPVAAFDGQAFFILDDGASIQTDPSSTQPFFSAPAQAFPFVSLDVGASIVGGAALAPVFDLLVPGSRGVVQCGVKSLVGPNSLAGVANTWGVQLGTVSSEFQQPQQSTGIVVTPALVGNQFFEVDVGPLAGGTATAVTGQNFTNATFLGVSLLTAGGTVGVPIVSFTVGGNVTVTSTNPADTSTYRVVFAGVVPPT